mgnify:CR=1 FL=1
MENLSVFYATKLSFSVKCKDGPLKTTRKIYKKHNRPFWLYVLLSIKTKWIFSREFTFVFSKIMRVCARAEDEISKKLHVI